MSVSCHPLCGGIPFSLGRDVTYANVLLYRLEKSYAVCPKMITVTTRACVALLEIYQGYTLAYSINSG